MSTGEHSEERIKAEKAAISRKQTMLRKNTLTEATIKHSLTKKVTLVPKQKTNLEVSKEEQLLNLLYLIRR